MKITPFFLRCLTFTLLITVWFGCKKPDASVPGIPPPGEDTTTTPTSGKLPEKNIRCTIQGQVHSENGQPFAGVIVTAGTSTATTDNYGLFRFDNITINQNGGMVRVDKAGYFTAIKNLFYKEGTVNYLDIQLIPKKLIGTFNAATGGTFKIEEAAVIFPENSLAIKSDSTPYTGTVNVYADYIGAGDKSLLPQMPGNLFSIPADNTVAALENYGLLAVSLETESGQELQLVANVEATVQMPAPANGPETLSFYSFDESSGFWNKETKATKTGNLYVGKVRHFSFWSPDVPFPVVDIEATITDQNSRPLVNQMVVIARSVADNFPAAYAITDSSGKVSGKVPMNEKLLLVMHNTCQDIIFSKDIGPFSANTNLGTLQANAGISWVTISGKLMGCGNAPLSNGYALVVIEERVFRSPVDKDGHFSMDIQNCFPNSMAIVRGVDVINAKQSNPVTTFLNVSQFDAGSLYTCFSMADEGFVSYSIDSTGYFYPMPGYVLGSFSASGLDTITTIDGYDEYIFNQSGITLHIRGGGAPGSYPLMDVAHQFMQQRMVMFPQSTMVHITGFGEVGQYITGHFSDTLIDEYQHANKPHFVKCVFRVKRFN